MTPLLAIDVIDPPDQVPAGEVIAVRLTVRRPPDQPGAVALGGVRSRDEARAAVNTDLLERGLVLGPGDEYTLTLAVRFATPGPADLRDFLVQANPVDQPEYERQLVPLPARPLRVVPSIDRQVAVSVARICAYDQGVKVEVAVGNVGDEEWRDLELAVGPGGAVRAGVTRRRISSLPPGERDRLTFELVVSGQVIEFALAGTSAGQRVEGRRIVPVPQAGDRATAFVPFAFLEPRNLPTDRVTLIPEAGGPPVLPAGGVYQVYGGKTRYLITIHPSDPQTERVELLDAAGQVEVEPRAPDGDGWPFLATVVENPAFTEPARMYYDVRVGGRTLRGELHLSVRPTSLKLWTIAATAGAAVTVKGVAGLAPALLRPDSALDGLFDDPAAFLQRSWTDWLLLLSIPVIRAGLWAADRLTCPFRQG
jgi:hypothetical protein